MPTTPPDIVEPFESLPINSPAYEAHVTEYGTVEPRETYEAVARLVSRVAPLLGDGGRVLDLGCGYGEVGAHLAHVGGHEVVGVDMDLDRLVSAQRGLPVVRADGALSFRDGSFDAVFMSQVISHVTDVSGTLREAFRVLRPGGRIVVSDSRRRDLRSWFLLNYEMRRVDAEVFVPEREAMLREAGVQHGLSLTEGQIRRLARRMRGWTRETIGRWAATGEWYEPPFLWVEPDTGIVEERVWEPEEVMEFLWDEGFTDIEHYPEIHQDMVPGGRLVLFFLEMLGIANHGYVVVGKRKGPDGP